MYSPLYISDEDPRIKYYEFPPTIDNKDVFRFSIASQQSSKTTTTTTTTTTVTSSNSSCQRLSLSASNIDNININSEDHSNNGVAYSSPVVVPVQHTPRYSSSDYIKSKIFNIIHKRDEEEETEEEEETMPSILPLNNSSNEQQQFEPMHMSVKLAIENSISSDWMQKYRQPSTTTPFGIFGKKSWKRRLFILVNKTVFIFKTSKSTGPAKEHFVLTKDTFVFVTEKFKGYIIELRKPLCTWYIKCESITQMKSWLSSMKKTVACIKIGYDGVLTANILTSITLTDDYRILIPNNTMTNSTKSVYRQSLPPINNNIVSVKRKHSLPSRKDRLTTSSLAEIPNWESTLPPQLPPPKSKPPPVPLPTVTEDF